MVCAVSRVSADRYLQALIIEAQALVEYSIDELYHVQCVVQPHVRSVLEQWMRGHGAWRVLVLVDESTLYPMSIELVEDPELQSTMYVHPCTCSMHSSHRSVAACSSVEQHSNERSCRCS